MDQSASEKAGFTGEGFTGQPAQGGAGNLGGLDGDDYDLGVDPLLGEGSAKKGAKGMLIVVLVVGLAAGSLFAMHTLTKMSAAAGRNDDIDRTIDIFIKGLGPEIDGPDGGGPDLVNSHNEIVKVLTNNYIESQVELDRDPFAMTADGGGADGGGDSTLSRSAVQRAFEKLDLKSVIGGSRPLANINGKIVRVNQLMPVRLSKMEGEIMFRVNEITRDSVTVEAVGVELEEPFEMKLLLKRNR